MASNVSMLDRPSRLGKGVADGVGGLYPRSYGPCTISQDKAS